MLTIEIPATDDYDPVTNTFYPVKAQTVTFEHSLVSLSKWESKWKKPFLSDKDRTYEESIDYLKCMSLSKNVEDRVFDIITRSPSLMSKVNAYIGDPMTATTFSDDKNQKRNREIVTSELIYYWMIALEIPFECQKWHLNRLLTLIRVCSIKNQPAKKMSKGEILRQNSALNAARRKAHGTRG